MAPHGSGRVKAKSPSLCDLVVNADGIPGDGRPVPSASAFTSTSRLEKIAQGSAVQSAARDHPVIDDDAAIAPADGRAVETSSVRDADEKGASISTTLSVELGRVEVGQTHLDPH